MSKNSGESKKEPMVAIIIQAARDPYDPFSHPIKVSDSLEELMLWCENKVNEENSSSDYASEPMAWESSGGPVLKSFGPEEVNAYTNNYGEFTWARIFSTANGECILDEG